MVQVDLAVDRLEAAKKIRPAIRVGGNPTLVSTLRLNCRKAF